MDNWSMNPHLRFLGLVLEDESRKSWQKFENANPKGKLEVKHPSKVKKRKPPTQLLDKFITISIKTLSSATARK